jgi:hypothetical protein
MFSTACLHIACMLQQMQVHTANQTTKHELAGVLLHTTLQATIPLHKCRQAAEPTIEPRQTTARRVLGPNNSSGHKPPINRSQDGAPMPQSNNSAATAFALSSAAYIRGVHASWAQRILMEGVVELPCEHKDTTLLSSVLAAATCLILFVGYAPAHQLGLPTLACVSAALRTAS